MMWVNGMPTDRVGRMVAMFHQKKSWTSTGVPRKNQM